MNSEFLQSTEWLRFQEATGKEVVPFTKDSFSANGIVHPLPLVGRYLYVPRGPIFENAQYQTSNVKKDIENLVTLAQEKKMKWVRIEPETEGAVAAIKEATTYKIIPAPHDMQPSEIFKIDITKTEEEFFQAMKPKTRYNIRLAEKHGVKVFETRETKHVEAFLDLITATSGRKGITVHPRTYYEKMLTTLPEDMCRLFMAEYQGRVLAANMVIFYVDTATYLHGGTSDEQRDVMAPFLLQWETIKYAKAQGYHFYDFGGVKTDVSKKHSWQGITRFKLGFSSQTLAIIYPGSYDIVLDSKIYFVYDILRRLRSLTVTFKKKFS